MSIIFNDLREWAKEIGHYPVTEAINRFLTMKGGSMKEQDIQSSILNKLAELGHYNIKVIAASKAGVVDIISCSPTGRFWSIEIKKPGEEPSKLQYWNLAEVQKRNGVAFWCDSVEDFLQKYNNATVV